LIPNEYRIKSYAAIRRQTYASCQNASRYKKKFAAQRQSRWDVRILLRAIAIPQNFRDAVESLILRTRLNRRLRARACASNESGVKFAALQSVRHTREILQSVGGKSTRLPGQ
jgi:hypothetical protein